ncbi:MAG: bifunctional adenosylcobinamide kinase/adenosylcobinamide-phosphate guanylyltransferase, partial [Aestuariivirga sp.]
TTFEAPVALAEAVREGALEGKFVLIDCITVWLGNLMHHGIDHHPHVAALCDVVKAAKGRLVIVSNEVGQGIVPDNPMARRFRDIQGIANQRLAAAADEVVFVTAGIPAVLKKSGTG